MTIIGPDAVPLTTSDRLNAARFNSVLGWTPFKPHRRWQSLLLHALRSQGDAVGHLSRRSCELS
ncbi:hypothetical protein CN933_27595 [Sinorhizobium sp. M4_45]|nr:hypothetical protein CN933_27595 [Sinorhizobium sp. M4_45]